MLTGWGLGKGEPLPSCSLAATGWGGGFLLTNSQHLGCLPVSHGGERPPKSWRAVGPVLLPIPGWPRPLVPAMAKARDELHLPSQVAGLQRGCKQSRSQLQAEQAKGMLFTDLLLPVPWSPACPACSVPPPVTAKVGGGDWAWRCQCGHPSGPLRSSPAPCILPHPCPAASSPLGGGSSERGCSESTRVSALLNVLPFFCTLLQSVLQALWSVQILPCRVNQGLEGGKK